MGQLKKYGLLACMAVFFSFFCTVTARPADKPVVVETFTGENEAVVYLKGITGQLSDATVQAGRTALESVAQSRLSETGQPVKTLVMLDNSISVKKASRGHILTLLEKIIAQRMEREQIAVAVFNKGLDYLVDYTSDEAALYKALDDITYQKTDTYLTDVLYGLLSEQYLQNTEDVFYRIVVLSDGVDNKEYGYTKEELAALLKEHPVPVYSVGLENAKKGNQKQLKSMFAISRLTGADSFLLKNKQSLRPILKSLDRDRDIVRLSAAIPQELMDGGKRTVKITFDSGKSVSKEVAMPQPLKADAKDPSPEQYTALADARPDTKDGQSEPEDEKKGQNLIPQLFRKPVIAGLAAALVLAAISVICAVRRRSGKISKREQNYYSRQGSVTGFSQKNAGKQKQGSISGKGQNDMKGQGIPDFKSGDGITVQEPEQWDSQRTERVSEDTQTEDDTEIDQDEGGEGSYSVTLTDRNVPSICFKILLCDSVTIGRSADCGVVIDYDKSVSGRHCRLTVQNGRFYVTDLNSSNGTFLDGRKIQTKAEISSGSLLGMGRLTFRFEQGDSW